MKEFARNSKRIIMIEDNGKIYERILGSETVSLLNATINEQGYRQYCFCGKTYRIARTVLKTFHPLEDYKNFQCDHVNRIRTDDRICNLRWATPKENSANRHDIPDSIKHLKGFLNESHIFEARTVDGELLIKGTVTEIYKYIGCVRSTVHNYSKSGKLYRGYIKFIRV